VNQDHSSRIQAVSTFRRFPGRTALSAVLLSLPLVMGAFLGCGSGKTAGPQRVPLTLEARGVGGAVQRLAAATPAPALAQDTIPVTFTRALLVVRDIRFVLPGAGGDDGEEDTLGVDEGEGDSTGTDVEHEDDGEDGAGQVRFAGPFVIDLLAGSNQNLGTQMVPAGVYTKIMGHLQPLHQGDAPAGLYPDLVGSTVLLEGNIAGEGGGHFLYSSRIDTEFVIHGSFDVAGSTPVTSFVVFDLSAFLRGNDGHFLDPRVAENDQLIRQAIRNAVKVGLDGNHDGEPDDDLAGSND